MKKSLVMMMGMALFSVSADASEWQILGPRALGMGGAHVAVANDATANYWNPAAYGFFGGGKDAKDDYGKRGWSANLGVGAGYQVHEDMGEQIDKVSKYDFAALTDGTMGAAEVKDFVGLVNELKDFNSNKNRAVTMLTDAGLSIQVGHFGVGVIGLGQISGKGLIDTINIAPSGVGSLTIASFADPANYGCPTCSTVALNGDATGLSAGQETTIYNYLTGTLGWTASEANGFTNAVDNGMKQSGVTVPADIVSQVEASAATATAAAGAGGSIDNNTSNITFKGQGIAEIPLTYGRAVNDNLSIGGNIKFMKAWTYDVQVPVFDKDFSKSLEAAKDRYEESTAFGVDLAALYRVGDFRIGLVGRNLNSPKFDVKRYTFAMAGGVATYNTPVSDDVTEKPQARAGVAYKPFDSLILAADYDLTENETTVSDDYKSRNIAVGAELNIFKFMQLRGGMYRNLAQSDMGNVYTAGLGLNFWLFNLDAGVSAASDKVTIDGTEYPKEVKGEVALSMLF